jgi:hypothetical protein
VHTVFLAKVPWAPWKMPWNTCHGLHGEFAVEKPEPISLRPMDSMDSIAVLGLKAMKEVRSGFSLGNSLRSPWYFSKALLHGAQGVAPREHCQTNKMGNPGFKDP